MTLAPALKDYIDGARWFGGKGRDWQVGGIRRVGTLPGSTRDLTVVIDLVEIAYADGDSDFYQVPLALYPDQQDRLGHALIGQVDDPELNQHWAYDAVHDRKAMALWLQAFASAADGKVTADDLAFHRVEGHDLDTEAHSTLFTGEQSNSSVLFGEDSLLKVFRKVTPGVNPDVSIHEVLTRAGSDHVAALFGWLDFVDMEADGTYSTIQLAMLQQFLRTATDGWELALASVRNLFAEADLHAEEVGGDFAGEAARLGRALAETHETLAEHFPVATLSADETAALAAAMRDRLAAAIDVVPELAEHADALRAAYDALGALSEVPVQQIHGDLHLAQTLRTVRGWKIVDFEGEPAKPLAERLLPDSPWRDVAGMLRSFDYAPSAVRMTSFAVDAGAGEESQQAYRATEWSQRNAEAFLTSYAGRELTAAERTLLDAYVADKAVYEAVYEARNRPTWVSIPLDALTRLSQSRTE
ncbi:MAG: phosphotransferase [Nocardioides sp.]|uniref:maltokinase N-terminal cap-like domain-containing protein n=1 Tax=Nocardioides sp. TaxID=35761 RepID=UPI00326554EF